MSEHGPEILEHRHPVVCDFCSAPGVRWSYPCETFIEFVTHDGRGRQQDYGSKGDWAACQPCSSDIERGDDEAVLVRAVTAFMHKMELDELPMAFVDKVRRMHEGFRKHRTGPREPFTPRPDDGLIVREEVED